ncbi:hypothetical protein FJZ31_18340 [Candidatus Poribacteria bacterium]|nr:hypothetical protein [Candidatus Poribacteria bacterium]
MKLQFETKIDGRLFVEKRIIHRSIRLITKTSFHTSGGEWTRPRGAIIDTGSHVSVIPRLIWTETHHSFISDEIEMGIGGKIITGRLGWITLRLHDEETISPPLSVKAHLIDDDSMPLILGFEDVISEVLLVSDFQQSIAYIIFRRGEI